MTDNENFNTDGYTINMQAVSESTDMMAVTRLLAKDIIRDGYTNVGDFVKNISEADLESLIKEMDQGPSDRQYENLMLISEMLATAEGCDASATMEDFSKRMDHLLTLLVIESLYRKGMVKVHHENMSFHPDMDDKIVVEKVEL